MITEISFCRNLANKVFQSWIRKPRWFFPISKRSLWRIDSREHGFLASKSNGKSFERDNFCSKENLLYDAETDSWFSRIINLQTRKWNLRSANAASDWKKPKKINQRILKRGARFFRLASCSTKSYGSIQDSIGAFHNNCWFEDSKPAKYSCWIPYSRMKNELLISWKLGESRSGTGNKKGSFGPSVFCNRIYLRQANSLKWDRV